MITALERCPMTSDVKTLWVPGIPRPQPRPRTVSHPGGIHTYTPDPYGWQAEIVAAWLKEHGREPLQGPVAVRLGFHFGQPEAGVNIEVRPAADGTAWRVKRPDIDRLTAAILDALSGRTLGRGAQYGLAWEDDVQVVDLWAIKLEKGVP